jgi:hypothetical protein
MRPRNACNQAQPQLCRSRLLLVSCCQPFQALTEPSTAFHLHRGKETAGLQLENGLLVALGVGLVHVCVADAVLPAIIILCHVCQWIGEHTAAEPASVAAGCAASQQLHLEHVLVFCPECCVTSPPRAARKHRSGFQQRLP